MLVPIQNLDAAVILWCVSHSLRHKNANMREFPKKMILIYGILTTFHFEEMARISYKSHIKRVLQCIMCMHCVYYRLHQAMRLDICSHPRDNRLRCALRCRHRCRLSCELRCNKDVNSDVNSTEKIYIRVHIWVNSPRDVDTDVDTDVDSDVNHFNACCYFPQCYLVPRNNVLQLRQHLSS